MITPFDLFGYGLYRYTFQMKCEEIPELKLDDGATRIFLNTRGEHPELVPSELIELLKYMQHSTDEVSGACESKRIQEMHRRVCQIRVQIPLHRITDSASNGSVFPVVTEHFSASSDHAFL